MDYWNVITGIGDGPGIDGGIAKRQKPEDTTVNTIDVEDLDKYIKLVEESGGTIVRPKGPVRGVGWLAYFRDTEGNLWGMMQEDPDAK